MERSEHIGMMVSGGAHAGAILWLLVGGIFFSHDLPPPVATAEVSLMSQAEFDAMLAAAPRAATEAPPQPSLPEPPAAEPTPPASEPDTPEPAPQPEPEPQPELDPSPDVTELTPPEAEVEDTPPTPPAPPVESTAPEVVTPNPQPRPADIVAPDPTDAPEEPAEVAPEVALDTRPAETAEPLPEPETEAAAPRETGDVLRTEENEDVVASAAPLTSIRPRARPETPAEPAPAAEPEPAPEPAAEPAPEPAETVAAPEPSEAPEDAVADALAEALAGEASEEPAPGTGTAASGPPMTGGEKDALVVAVKQCWNVGSLSTDALRTVVTVGVSMDPSGKPVSGSIRMIGYEGGSDASAQQAYEAGRRAIIRCGQNGFPLPPEKYDQWQEIEITFDPEQMRMK